MNIGGRQFKKGLSIRHRITIYVTLLVIAVVSVTTFLAVGSESDVLTKKTVHYIEHIANDIAFGAEKAFVSLNWIFVEDMLIKHSKEEANDLVYIKLIKPNGEVYMASDRCYYGDLVEPSFMVSRNTLLTDYQFSGAAKRGFLFIHPFEVSNELWRVVVGISDTSIKASINSLMLENIFFGGLVVLLGMFISYLLAKSISNPVVSLTKAVSAVSTSELDYRVEVKSSDEVGALACAFNEMADKLQQSYATLEDKVCQRTSELAETVEKLNDSNSQLENFAYIASHDLREPLRKISAFGAMLQKSVGSSLCESDSENLSYMIDGASRMNAMIEGLLAYSRITMRSCKFQQVDLNELVLELKKFELSVLIEQSSTVIEIPELLNTVYGDASQLRQLMQNLIANGIKYQPNGNTPVIVIRSSLTKDDMVKVEITDNGIGIPSSGCNDIFVMFRRLHSRSQYEGTGIGLSVCKRIVARHGGQIGVESEQGRGSTFWFILPSSCNACASVDESSMVSAV